MTRVDLIVNGEVKESVAVSEWKGSGNALLHLSIDNKVHPGHRHSYTGHLPGDS